jgi:DNA helicase II / ATP-dependent DNA helicase PcrA
MKYEHVIVDEFQDLTEGEQALFMRLRKPDGSFVALGDSKQSIYRFRGSDREGLSKLQQMDPTATITHIPMQDCFRCPASLVLAANDLMTLYPPPMEPRSQTVANIHHVYWKTPQAEANGLAKQIANNISAYPTDRHLAMVTRRDFGYLLRNALKAINPELSVDLGFSESLLETWPVREAFIFFCLLVDPDPATWRAWLGYQTPDRKGVYKAPKRNADAYLQLLTSTNDSIGLTTIELLAQEPRTKSRGSGGTNLWDRATRFLERRSALGNVEGSDALKVLLSIFDANQWAAGANATALTDFDIVRTRCTLLVDEVNEAKPDATVAELLQAIARRLRYMVATREPFEPLGKSSLKVTTLWGAKGLTADHVYLVGLCKEALPGNRRNDYPGSAVDYEEEQRRLFYVSLTRSRRTLVLSRATKIHVNKAKELGLSVERPKRGYWATLQMSSFLRDILPRLPEAKAGATWTGCGP